MKTNPPKPESNGRSTVFKKGNKLAKGGARPNSGMIPREVREACRLKVYDRIGILCKIMDNPEAEDKNKIAAWRALASVGMPAQIEVDTPKMNPIGDREVVDAYIKLGVVQEKWTPGILRRYQAGMIEGHPKQVTAIVVQPRPDGCSRPSWED